MTVSIIISLNLNKNNRKSQIWTQYQNIMLCWSFILELHLSIVRVQNKNCPNKTTLLNYNETHDRRSDQTNIMERYINSDGH